MNKQNPDPREKRVRGLCVGKAMQHKAGNEETDESDTARAQRCQRKKARRGFV